MELAHDPIAAMRAVISQYNLTDDGLVLIDGRPASAGDLVKLKRAIEAFEALLQHMIDGEVQTKAAGE